MAKKKRRKHELAWQIARERIAQAEREQATALDLTNLGLTALPPEIGRLTRFDIQQGYACKNAYLRVY